MKLNCNLFSLTDCHCVHTSLPSHAQRGWPAQETVTAGMGCREVLLRDFNPWMWLPVQLGLWQGGSQKTLLTSLISSCRLLLQCCSSGSGQKAGTCLPAHHWCLSPARPCSTCPLSPFLHGFYIPTCPGLNLECCPLDFTFVSETKHNFAICLVLLFNLCISKPDSSLSSPHTSLSFSLRNQNKPKRKGKSKANLLQAALTISYLGHHDLKQIFSAHMAVPLDPRHGNCHKLQSEVP